jgi:hypothetical protein
MNCFKMSFILSDIVPSGIVDPPGYLRLKTRRCYSHHSLQGLLPEVFSIRMDMAHAFFQVGSINS